MNLTVVTLTNKSLGRDLTRVIASVKDALPENSKHEIIEATSDLNEFAKVRYNSMKLGDIVVIVDDDDYIAKDSLYHVKEALEATDTGIAFTREVTVSLNGTSKIWPYCRQYKHIALGPNSIHHMTAFNTKYVTQRAIDTALKYGTGIEWILRADAAYNKGAIHVPYDGYYWIQHHTNFHSYRTWNDAHKKNSKALSQELSTWNKHTNQQIPVWQLTR